FGKSYPPVQAIVGRLHPAYLAVEGNAPMLQAPSTCNFAHQSQPIRYSAPPMLTVRGYNRQGTLTQNYDGAFFRLGNPVPEYANTASTSSVLTPNVTGRTFSRVTDPIFNGQASITLT